MLTEALVTPEGTSEVVVPGFVPEPEGAAVVVTPPGLLPEVTGAGAALVVLEVAGAPGMDVVDAELADDEAGAEALVSIVSPSVEVSPMPDELSGAELVSPSGTAPGPLNCHQSNLKPPPLNRRKRSCLPVAFSTAQV